MWERRRRGCLDENGARGPRGTVHILLQTTEGGHAWHGVAATCDKMTPVRRRSRGGPRLVMGESCWCGTGPKMNSNISYLLKKFE
jgi:hypothetical protein